MRPLFTTLTNAAASMTIQYSYLSSCLEMSTDFNGWTVRCESAPRGARSEENCTYVDILFIFICITNIFNCITTTMNHTSCS